MKNLFTLILILFFFMGGYVHAETPALDLTNLLNAVQTMRADFTQTIYDNHGKAVQKSYGRMALMRPGKFRWEVSKPIPQLLIANASRIWIYDADLQQVTIRPLDHATGEAPALLLSHVNHVIEQDFIVKTLANKNTGLDLQWFALTPKKADSMFAAVEMGFDKTQIREMRLKDQLGHTTKIRFEHIEVNKTLSPALFIFKTPKNVDVIDETKKQRKS